MKYTTITVHVKDQSVHLANFPLLASGGVNEIQIICDFCSLWEGFGKSAVFYRKGGPVFTIPLVNDRTIVPWEVMTDSGVAFFGVFGTDGTITRTTEMVALEVVDGAITSATAEHQDPTPDIYTLLLAAIGLNEARLNNLLTAGTVDGELIDIRVGADGTRYETAGDAVRRQFQNPTTNMDLGEHSLTAYEIGVSGVEGDAARMRLHGSRKDADGSDVALVKLYGTGGIPATFKNLAPAVENDEPVTKGQLDEIQDDLQGDIRSLEMPIVRIDYDEASGKITVNRLHAEIAALVDNGKQLQVRLFYMETAGDETLAVNGMWMKQDLYGNAFVFRFSGIGDIVLPNDNMAFWVLPPKNVRYDIAQELTDEQKAQARENIGAEEASAIVEITVDESEGPVQISATMDYAQIHSVFSQTGYLQTVLHLTDRFGTAHTYRTADVKLDSYGYAFYFDGYGTVTVDSGDEWYVDPAPVEMIGGVTYAHRLGVRGVQAEEGRDPDGVFAEFAGTRDDGVTDQVQLNSTLNYGSPVGIRGVAEGIGDTDAVNKKQLDDAGIALLDKVCPAFTESGAVVTCEPVEGYPLEVTADEGANITRCGRNFFGGELLADTIVARGGKKFKDETGANIIEFNASNVGDRTILFFTRFKENTQYTFVFYGKNTNSTYSINHFNIRVRHTDGTSIAFEGKTPGKYEQIVITSHAGKTVEGLGFTIYGGKVDLQYDLCGVFEGVITAEEFEAYTSATFAQGEQIPALKGVNTLWADKGIITVSGKADPVARLEKLENAILAMGANV